ncbi:MAG: FHA domain-containing protein [Clostridiales bacterium]|nr:FHA domain-containing protein [Clostridiales bacterium]
MIYEIQSKNDIIAGSSLIIKIPEEDLDQKALYTIQEDRPAFLLPFRHRAIDGQIEFVYQIGAQSKPQYLAGVRNPKEYAELWSGVLNPLFDCGDWFLRPYSFVLDINHLYCDKNNNSVSYVYIPSRRDCSDYFALKEMAAEFSRQITVNVADLENKVLRAIMLDFNPKAFLQMLKAYNSVSASPISFPIQDQRRNYEQKALPMPEETFPKQEDLSMQNLNISKQRDNPSGVSGDIIIDIPTECKPAKKNKKNLTGKGSSRAKKDKQPKRSKRANGLFENKAEIKQDMIIGAAPAQYSTVITAPQQSAPLLPQYYDESHRCFSQDETPPSDVTQNISFDVNGVWMRLIGNASLPPAIDIAIADGEVFTVGRYDIATGRRQSDFEFDRKTKAVSRRHAAIERRPDGYSLIDLSSSAGTFIDGQKLPPNTPCRLQSGCRVSFGNCGADYIWEQAV